MTSSSSRAHSAPFSISHTLRYGIVTLVASSVIAVGGLTTWFNYQNQLNILRDLKQSQVENSANKISFFLTQLKDPLNYLARLPGITELSPERQSNFLRTIAESSDAYFAIAIVDIEGKVSSSITPFSQNTEEEIEYLLNGSQVDWQKIITTGEQDISPVKVRKDQGLSVITVGLPMRNNEGKLSGALLTQINLEQLQYIINQSQTGDSGYLYIVDQNNLVITQTLRAETSYQDFSLQQLKDPTLIQQVRDQSLDKRYLNQYQGLQGLSVLGASSNIYAVDWFVVVELPSQELDKVVWNSLIISCLVLLGAGGVSIAAGFILSRSILIPLQRLNAAALSISAGYLDTKVPEGFRNEFGTLANAFNTMVNQVRQSFQSLEQKNGDLKSTLEKLKSTQTQLIQTEKMSSLGQLVAGVAHELNNPIGFIHGNVAHTRSHSEALLEAIALYQEHGVEESDELREQLEELDIDYICDDFPKLLSSIEDGTNRVQSIVKSLRNFSRLDESESKHVDIHEGIENTLVILRSKLKGNSKSYVVEVVKDYGDVPPVECYPAQLNQVILNLIDNAIHALSQLRYCEPSQAGPVNSDGGEETDSRPVIVISTGVDGVLPAKNGDAERTPCCWIRVRDNGAGIPEAVRDRIFDPFFTTKPVGQGTGLGLSISYKIITETHGGSLTCNSVVGEGTEFTIRIPTTQKVEEGTPTKSTAR